MAQTRMVFADNTPRAPRWGMRAWLSVCHANRGAMSLPVPALLALLLTCAAATADDELPGVEFSDLPPVVNYSGLSSVSKPEPPDLGLLIEGERAKQRGLGQLILGNDSQDRILYEDDHHRVIGNPARPIVRMMYRYDPQSTEWLYDGSIVRGHVQPGSKFGWSVSVSKPYMAILDWRAKPIEAAIVIYEKSPNSIRGWKKRFEVVADNEKQAQCMGGLDAGKWLTRWTDNRGTACGVTTIDWSQARKPATAANTSN